MRNVFRLLVGKFDGKYRLENLDIDGGYENFILEGYDMAGLRILLCGAANLSRIWSACSQREVQCKK
jgi:hypothetical protein